MNRFKQCICSSEMLRNYQYQLFSRLRGLFHFVYLCNEAGFQEQCNFVILLNDYVILVFFYVHFFSLECMSDFYGENCSKNCGYCLNNETCHHINGNCEHGCNPGYMAPFCNEGNHSDSLPRLTSSMQHF